MSRITTERFNTDYMFNGCAEFDATGLSLHSISPYITSMNCMFRGCAVRGSTALDGENIKFNHLLRCDDAFRDAGFGFNDTYMQFYGDHATIGSGTIYVSSLRELFRGNRFTKDVAPTIILSKNNGLTTKSSILAALDSRFADPGSTSTTSDIYQYGYGVFDFHGTYSDMSIKSVDMRGICNCLDSTHCVDTDGKCGKIDFSNMFENCGELTTYTGFIPQYGSTYHAFFNNCSSLSVNLGEMFKNYYSADPNGGEYYLGSIDTTEGGGWTVDNTVKRNGYNSLRFDCTGTSTSRQYYFSLKKKSGENYEDVTFTANKLVRITFSARTNINPMAKNHGDWEFGWAVGSTDADDKFASKFPVSDDWTDVGGTVTTADGGKLVLGIEGTIPTNGKFWISNVSIESDDVHIRIGNFSSNGNNEPKIKYKFTNSEAGFKPAYNANTALDGYCMSSISYMFNNCSMVYSESDEFDLVTLVKNTVKTIGNLGRKPLEHKECFEYAFPMMTIATYSPHYNLSTVRYDIGNISKKFGVVRYCSFNGDSDNDAYGVGTTYIKWLFPNGFIRYGGAFIDNPGYIFYIPYYRVENENGDLIDVRPHIIRNGSGLTPSTFSSTYNRSAHFKDHYVWLSNHTNPFLGGDTKECNKHRTYNWINSSDVLYGAIICDTNGKFVKYAYVGNWSEGVYMFGYHTACQGSYTVTAERYHPVTIYNGTSRIPIPEAGSTLKELNSITDRKLAELSKLGYQIISSSDESHPLLWRMQNSFFKMVKRLFGI